MGGRRTKPPLRHRAVLTYLLKAVVLLAVYVVTARLGLALNAVGHFAAPVWPPTGIVIAFVWLWGESMLPVVLLGAMIVNASVGAPLPVAMVLGAGNAAEGFVAVALLRRLDFHASFDRIRDVIGFAVAGSILGPMTSATVGVTTLFLAHLTPAGYVATWITWWMGDALGAIVVAPVILTVATLGMPRKMTNALRVERFVLFSLILIVESFLFLKPGSQEFGSPLLLFLFPLFAWTAIRFGPRGISIVTFFTSAIAIAGTVLMRGVFWHGNPLTEDLLLLQAFLAIIAVPHLLIAAANEERQRARHEVEELNRTLAEKVARQTASLTMDKEKDEAIIENLGEGLIVIDTRGRITMSNSAGMRLLGLSSGRVAGKPFDDVIRMENSVGRTIPKRSRPLQRTLDTGKGVEVTSADPAFYVRADRTRFPVALTTAPIVSNGKLVGAVQVFRDVTAVQEFNKAKSEFVALASHQLRTPTTSIRWYADQLLEGKGLPKKIRADVRAVRDSAVRMADIVSVLLGVSRVDLGTFAPKKVAVDVRQTVNDVVADVAGMIDMKKIRLEKRLSGDVSNVRAEPTVLRVVMQNLVSNAVKYSPSGSVVTLWVARAGKTLTVTVTDHGSGIPAAVQPKIFSKFYRADNARLIDPEGNGLGLYLCKAMLERIGGTITFRSELGKGTTFVATIPVA